MVEFVLLILRAVDGEFTPIENMGPLYSGVHRGPVREIFWGVEWQFAFPQQPHFTNKQNDIILTFRMKYGFVVTSNCGTPYTRFLHNMTRWEYIRNKSV